MPNWSGPMPEPVTSVRLPHSAPAPNASCMYLTPLRRAGASPPGWRVSPALHVGETPLQFFLGGEDVVPDLRHLSHRRTREMIFPPTLDQLLERRRRWCSLRRRRGKVACSVFLHVSAPVTEGVIARSGSSKAIPI